MRICLVYDCLFPYTVGGGERWYRGLAERLAADGHEVTYLTLRQWDRGATPDLGLGIRVRAVGPRLALYTDSGRRRIAPPLAFGLGVLAHLARHGGDYDVVHTGAFPYFSLLAAALMRPRRGFALVVDWFEVWSDDYWRDYLGPVGGPIGAAVQRLCARLPQRAFCLSQLHARRLREEGLRGEPIVLRGLYAGPPGAQTPAADPPTAVFAGRLIPEKRAPLAVAGIARAARSIDGLRGEILGDGPERGAVDAAIDSDGARGVVSARGFVAGEQVEEALAGALCLVLPSRREGYGLVVVEAASHGTPSVVVADPDSAATELIEEGVNGTVVARADPQAIAAAIVRVHAAGPALRDATARWFNDHADELSVDASLRHVLATYRERGERAHA